MRTLLIASAAALVAVMAAPEAIAQQAKKNAAKCPANFQEICMQRCTTRGGQVRFCPQYCAQQQRERCPR